MAEKITTVGSRSKFKGLDHMFLLAGAPGPIPEITQYPELYWEVSYTRRRPGILPTRAQKNTKC